MEIVTAMLTTYMVKVGLIVGASLVGLCVVWCAASYLSSEDRTVEIHPV